MKNWKLILLFAVIVIGVVSILFMNKKKMNASSVGGIKDVYYVKVEKAVQKNLAESLSLVGTVAANNDVNIISETSGKVTAVYIKVGDYKPAGSVLFQVDDELRKAALMSAEANYEKAKKDFERFQSLHKEKSASDSQLDQIKLAYSLAESQYIVAKRQYNDTQIKTPISGYVTAKYVDVGAMLQGPPQPTLVANIVDISRLKVKINVAEKDAFMIKAGDPVSVTVDVYPGNVFKGRIESVSAKADEAHTYPVEINVVNERENPLKAGMFARVEFTSIKDRKSIVIPRESLVGSIKQPRVFVVENEVAKLRDVVVGNESGVFVEILQGLMEGEEIIVNGQNNIVDNTRVTVIK
ncbi:MAG TPA: efflux RND transporter periplasmic adaptor subunit [Melioribacteraceae bacterium]|nr:efflux RND transporter periplasmic adaptor subunit [Melioribacteraceae bacterium]